MVEISFCYNKEKKGEVFMKKRIITAVSLCLLIVMLFTLTACNSTTAAHKKVCKYIKENGEYYKGTFSGQYSIDFGDKYEIYYFEDSEDPEFWVNYYKNGIQFYFCFDSKNSDSHYWRFTSVTGVKFSGSGTMYSEEYDGSVKDIPYRMILKDYEGSSSMKSTHKEIMEVFCYSTLKALDDYLQTIDIGVRLEDLGFSNYVNQ